MRYQGFRRALGLGVRPRSFRGNLAIESRGCSKLCARTRGCAGSRFPRSLPRWAAVGKGPLVVQPQLPASGAVELHWRRPLISATPALVWPRSDSSMELNHDELRRYARHLILPEQREQRLGRSRPPVKAAHQCAGFRDAWFALLCSPWRYLRNAECADTLPVLQEPGSERSRVCPTHSRRRFVPVQHMPRVMAPSERSELAAGSGLARTQEN